jgi:acetyltransferase-like isoleucine patch superfamily enzyme
MKTGRDLLKTWKKVINIIVLLDSIIPYKINNFFYSCFKNIPGYFGLLIRYILLKNLLKECGENLSVHPHVIIKNKQNLSIGNNVSVHSFCYIDALGDIKIGDNVSIAHNSSLISFDHDWQDITIPIKYNRLIKANIVINDDVWIGCGVRILKGVTIHSRSVIAAGSVVLNNIEEGSLVGGVPAKLLKKIIK